MYNLTGEKQSMSPSPGPPVFVIVNMILSLTHAPSTEMEDLSQGKLHGTKSGGAGAGMLSKTQESKGNNTASMQRVRPSIAELLNVVEILKLTHSPGFKVPISKLNVLLPKSVLPMEAASKVISVSKEM